MTIGELKAANSSILRGIFTWAYITSRTAWEVRQMLRDRRPDIYY
jgi:hypothetical protein